MGRLLRGLAIAICCLCSQASAQLLTTGAGCQPTVCSGGGATYTGPGDVVSGATQWWGLRAYNAAYATGSNNALNLRRASDNTTQNIVILSNGKIDVASANTFAGTDASCTGTIATTTMTISSCSSGTLHVNDTITGTGITQPAYITSIGTCASPPGTCTLNASQTVSVAETITAQVALFVTEAFDQTGNSRHVIQNTNSAQPQFLPSCFGGTLPCMLYNNSNSTTLATSATFAPTSPVTVTATFERTGNTSTLQNYVSVNSAAAMRMSGAPSANNCRLSNSATNVSCSDNASHSAIGVLNGASSTLNIDGTDTSISGGSSVAAGTTVLGDANVAGYIGEGGIWNNLGFTSGNRSSMHTNMSAYWGTP